MTCSKSEVSPSIILFNFLLQIPKLMTTQLEGAERILELGTSNSQHFRRQAPKFDSYKFTGHPRPVHS